MFLTRNQKNNRFIKGLLIVFSMIFVVVSASCGQKDVVEKPVVESPSVVIPNTGNDKVKEPAVIVGGEKEEINSEELKDLFKSGKSMDEVSYTMKLVGNGEEPILTKVWMKKGKMRFESTIMNQTVISIMNEDAFYTLSVDEKMAMKVPINKGDKSIDKPFSLDDVTENVDFDNFKYVGREKINGVDCIVVETKNEDLGTSKMWLNEKYGLAMKMETVAKNEEGSFSMEMTEFSAGNVSDALFDVPEGYEILDLGNLEFPMIPNMPSKP